MKRTGLQALDRFDIQLAGDLDAAADYFVYQRCHADIRSDAIQARLWRCGADGSDHRPIAQGSSQQSCGRLSPDGGRLAWIDTACGTAQIHLLDLASGQGGQITRLPDAPSQLSWSPCGRMLAFYMEVARPDPDWVQMQRQQPGCDWAAPPQISERLPYKLDGRGYLPQADSQLFVLDLESGHCRQLSAFPHGVNDSFVVQAPVWTADGAELLVLANGSEDPVLQARKLDVWAVSRTGELRALTDFPGMCVALALSPDGSKLALIAAPDQGECWPQNAPYVLDLASAELCPLAVGLDRSVAEFLDNGGRAMHWAADGTAFYALFDDRGRTHLGRFALDGSHQVVVEDLCQGSSGYGLGASFALLDDGSFVFVRGRAREWPEIRRQDRQGQIHTLTGMNQALAAQRELAGVRQLEFRNPVDDWAVQGWLYTPPDFDATQRYPLILEIHGGPHNNFGDRFWPRVQVMAAQGYCVLLVNPRGSTSYGHGFTRGIEHCYPGPDVADLLAGVDAACELPFVDQRNLFVTGISGGGTLTTAIVAVTDRFRAAAALCPFVDWFSQSLAADIAPHFRYMMPGFAWEQPERFWRHSTLAQVGKVNTPVMLQGGDLDHRTPFSHAEQYYQALKFRQIDTVLVRFGGENHGTAARPSHGMQSIELVLSWFARYRQESAPA